MTHVNSFTEYDFTIILVEMLTKLLAEVNYGKPDKEQLKVCLDFKDYKYYADIAIVKNGEAQAVFEVKMNLSSNAIITIQNGVEQLKSFYPENKQLKRILLIWPNLNIDEANEFAANNKEVEEYNISIVDSSFIFELTNHKNISREIVSELRKLVLNSPISDPRKTLISNIGYRHSTIYPKALSSIIR